MMDGHVNETGHVVSLRKFENKQKHKEEILQEIKTAICAMLNSNGGKVVIHIDTDTNDIPVEDSQMLSVIRILEQSIIKIIGLSHTVSHIGFKKDEERIIISVKEVDSLVTLNYNLFLPSESQVVEVAPLENINANIINRKVVPQPIQLGSHCQVFFKGKKCGLQESKVVQFKNLKAISSKRTRLADRITGKGNKFSCYVSAFADHCGGHTYYGIDDDGVVEGEWIPNEDKYEITKKVEKAINKMIWPNRIGQPKRGEHWEIFFEPVVDENSKPIPSTFVIVIYIAPCLGGVFTEEPECYEMVDGKVQKMSFATWKKRLSQPVWLRSKDEISPSVQRITWSSPEARKAFTFDSDELRKMVSNGHWDAVLKECKSLQSKSDSRETMQLVILYKRIIGCNRRGKFIEASTLIKEYLNISHQVPDTLIFEMLGLYLQAALKRASGDFKALEELLTAALSKAELIEPGLVTAIVYVFAATVSDLINLKRPTSKIDSPDVLSMRALEHLRSVQDPSDLVVDMKRKAYITLATFHLGCNINGEIIKDNIDNACLDKAETSIKVIHQSAYQENPLSLYFDVQLNLVQSKFNYRRAQLSLNQRNEFLRIAYNFAIKPKRLANEHQFTELVKWSKANENVCTEELKRVNNANYDRTEQQGGDDHRDSSEEQRDHRDRSIQIAEKHTDRRDRTEQVERQDRTEQDGRLESSKENSRSMEPEKDKTENAKLMETSKPGCMPSGRQGQRYTPPGQSEMLKHVHAKPFQPASSSPSGQATYQISPNVRQVPTASGQSNVTPAYHMNNVVLPMHAIGTSAFDDSVSSSACLSYHQFLPFQCPSWDPYGTPVPIHPTTMRFANQDMRLRALNPVGAAQPQMATYRPYQTFLRHRQPTPQPQQRQQMFRSQQHRPNRPRFGNNRYF